MLAGIDIGPVPRLEQEGGHISGEKRPGLRIHHIQAVMIDEHGLLAAPVCPALAADLARHAGPDLTWEGSFLEALSSLPATGTGNLSHPLRPRVLDLRQPEE